MGLWGNLKRRALDAPIKWKLIFTILVACAVVLSMSFASYLFIEIISHRREMAEELSTQAAVISSVGRAALIDRDKKAVQEKLESLRTHGDIARAYVLTKNDQVFASMIKNGRGPDYDPKLPFREGETAFWTMSHYEEIKHDGKVIGRVYMESDFEELYGDLVGAVQAFILISVIALPIAVRLSLWLQNIIFNPLLKPAVAAGSDLNEKDVTAGVEKRIRDEVGKLTESTSLMLKEIQERGDEQEKRRRKLEAEIVDGEWRGNDKRKSESRFQAMAQTTPTPILISRASDNAVLYANRHLADVLGLSLDRLYSLKTLDFYYDPNDRQILLDTLKGKGFVQSQELRVKRQDGSMVWVSVSMRPLIFEDVPAVMVTLVDITEQKENLAILQNFSKKLVASLDSERKRVAAELHDGLGQNLLLIKSGLKKHLRSVPHESPGYESLGKMVSITQQLIDDVRIIAWNLHPHQLDKLGLTGAIKSTIRKNSKFSNIRFTEEIGDIDGLLPKDRELHVYRVIQELISNIIKHSGANEVHIGMKRADGYLNVIIFDNGTGFEISSKDISRPDGVGMGMTGILERMMILDGSFDIEPSPTGGSIISIKIPVKAA